MQSAYQRDAPQLPCCRCCCPTAPLCCSTAVLHKCNWWGYLITGLGCTPAPCLCCSSSWTRLGLGLRVQTFLVSLFELASLGFLGLGSLGTLDKCFHEKLSKLSKFTASSCISPFDEERVERRLSC